MLLASDRLDLLLTRFRSLRTLVIGDLMLDEFLWGRVRRLSPEAPVPVVEVQRSSRFPGGAANVARNLLEFTPLVTLCGAVGDDSPGEELIHGLKGTGCDISGILRLPGRATTLKTRVFGRQQQIVRVDRETRDPLPPSARGELLAFLRQTIPACDLILLEDYAKGLLDQEIVDLVLEEATRAGRLTAADPHTLNRLSWKGVSVLKPNRSEALALSGLEDPEESLPSIEKAARLLQERWGCLHLLVTLGEEGMLLLDEMSRSRRIPTAAREVFDVSGAGDTSLCLFSLALAAGSEAWEAAKLANLGAGIVVGKLGTATVSPEELRAHLTAGS
ncbi:bifunctional heptose 7-phosphate kinase/heptose 1-phosphate adenyltransferase [Methylacidimicrobium tartarophylax]|uniref:D-glycero-beta-D-manno-heptose-7-phosphate kinase n=1 Tax=Methylacidimicrobium tartarophylax TaxID=1041768 RepID=A0A5E6MFV0_9BACT|nr:PfkB family carbohydrate kinase [Methylacidimicrobium tartarophylax]VVM07891.1 D-glycero-beta-D-manno-heptose-7-phosphate kinase [Methylacidimicrobium tartarophylax]